MQRRHHLIVALRDHGFRRLFTTRLAAQFGDGVFQASLAGTVLFSPERQAHAADVAASFAVLLLPYSLIGPFAGVFIDRWWRRQILLRANLIRTVAVLGFAAEVWVGLSGVPFYASALVLISLGRFILSALSAALPRVVPAGELVTANALCATSGSIATAAGGAGAIALRSLIGGSNGDYAVIAVLAGVLFLASALAARGFGREALGPSHEERAARESLRHVARGLAAGAQHAWTRPPVRYALAAAGAHRLGYGITSVTTLLLYRNYFHGGGVFRAGLPGLAQVVLAVAVGGGLAAAVTPAMFRHIGPVRWIGGLLAAAGAVVAGLFAQYDRPQLVAGALLLGFAGQSIKISVDTVVQQRVEDDFRGRVFSLYDTLFNLALVAAAGLTATVLPEDGHSPTAAFTVAVGYVVAAVTYLRLAGAHDHHAPLPAPVSAEPTRR